MRHSPKIYLDLCIKPSQSRLELELQRNMSGFLFSYMYCNWHRNKTHKVASAPAVKLSVLNAEIQIIFWDSACWKTSRRDCLLWKTEQNTRRKCYFIFWQSFLQGNKRCIRSDQTRPNISYLVFRLAGYDSAISISSPSINSWNFFCLFFIYQCYSWSNRSRCTSWKRSMMKCSRIWSLKINWN